ncbi:MAG: hypothetical protein FWC40_06595 [Proteobacteria bacterium]|nr:hypothetical protein [Pseudomonadota bacterium]
MLPVFGQDAVAKDIEAVCSKCGEAWHVVVAVADGKIVKVQCKSCQGYHRYRPIATERMTLKQSTKSTIAASTRQGSPMPKPATERATSGATKAIQPYVKANDRTPRPYSMKSADYLLGDRVTHAKFGQGIVDGFPAPNKMFVSFETKRLLLVYGK